MTYLVTVCALLYLVVAIALWVDAGQRVRRPVVISVPVVVWPLVVVFALVAVGADAALAVFRRR